MAAYSSTGKDRLRVGGRGNYGTGSEATGFSDQGSCGSHPGLALEGWEVASRTGPGLGGRYLRTPRESIFGGGRAH
jgi:hypothetical protein